MITSEQLIGVGFKPDKDGALCLIDDQHYIEWLSDPGIVFQVRESGTTRFLFNIIIESLDQFIRFYYSITGITLNHTQSSGLS